MNKKYQIIFDKPLQKFLKNIPLPDQEKIVSKTKELALNPRPRGVTKLKEHSDEYRIRSGNYRIVYRIEDRKLIILVLKIAHRKEVYK